MTSTISISSTYGFNLDAGVSQPIIVEQNVSITYPGHPQALYTNIGSSTFFTVENSGSIAESGFAFGTAVYLAPGGSITNSSSGSITGNTGIKIAGSIGTVVNDGIVTGSSSVGAGVTLGGGGTVTNAASASIAGYAHGVDITGGHGTVVNAGTIFGTASSGIGIQLGATGSVTNAATGTISGANVGVYLPAGSTLTNAGSISSAFGYAVYFSGAGASRLVVNPGAGFYGTVDGGSSGTSTLELGSAAAAGTVGGIGTQFINFGPIQFDSGAKWSIAGNLAGLAGPISGFAAGDTIEVTGVTATETLYSGGVLTLASGATLDLAGAFSAGALRIADVAGNSDVTIACFAAGTRIATDRGAVAVERLAVGDQVCSAFGGSVPVTWLGHRTLDCMRHPRPHDVLPIRVRAHAFGPGRPARDLRLSPDHAVYVEGGLIPVRYLVNGRTVAREATGAVTYWHVELPTHDVLLAEGLECESYLDTGNRSAFANGGGAVALHADFALRVWAAEACAPLVHEGGGLVAARLGLLERAAALGHRLTTEPGLETWVDGSKAAAEVRGSGWRVALPGGARTLRLRSRRWVPAETLAAGGDARGLGVAVAAVRLDGVAVRLDDARLASGWLAPEGDWRWTDGDATVVVGGVGEVEFEVAMTGTYWAEAGPEGVRRAG